MPRLQTIVPDDLAAQIAARGDASSAIRSALETHFDLLELARRGLREVLGEQELAAICDIMNGTIAEPFMAGALAAEAEDADQAVFARHGVERSALLEKLRRLEPVEEAALLDAVERFWRAAATGMPVDPGRILEE